MDYRVVNFKVNGKDTSDDALLINIPCAYKDLFEGHDFPDMHTLSMALMHANCATEAKYYKMPWKVEIYERDLLNTLEVTQ